MVNNIKNENLDFNVYPGAAVFSEFKKEFGMSLEKLLQEDPTNAEAFAFAVFVGHKCYCRLKNAEEKVTVEDLTYKMTFQELADALTKVLPNQEPIQKKMQVKK
jgi:hypothetical protein